MELTSEDKQRIEQEAKLYAKNHSAAPDKETPDWIITDFMNGAEYATIYEREQQAIPKQCHFCGGNGFIMGYENSSRACKYCNGSGQITENIECLSLPECYASSKKLEALEAERSELTGRIEKLENAISDTLYQWKQGDGLTGMMITKLKLTLNKKA